MISKDSLLLDTATRMAVAGHAAQVRKDDNSPYIVHPFMVALIVAKHGFDDAVIAAALTHDLVEDTPLTLEELREALGDEVADIVASVTNDDSLSWEEKKLKYIETVRVGAEGAKAVATADKVHNAQSLIASYGRLGPALWDNFNAGRDKKIWFEEKMLEMLKETWQHPLVDEYEVLLARMRALV